MKKQTKIILGLIFLGIIAFLLWPRSLKRMETIAKHELQNNIHKSIVGELEGPLVDKQEEYAEFIWYKKLEWGDTSKIFIRVCRDIFSCNRYDNWWRNFIGFIEPDITMNHQWEYVTETGTSNFEKVFPSGSKGIKVMASMPEMHSDSIKINSFEFTVPAEHLIYFLRKGYFEVLEQEGETTIIAFYEPIINIYRKNKKYAVPLLTAKALTNDTTGITIIPHDYYNVLK